MANDILVKIGADITDFSRKMAESNQALRNFGKANAETFDAFKKTGAAITGAGLALAGGLGAAVKVAAGFEASMSNVQAISGSSASDMELLSTKAREMGASTKFSASEAADAMSYMALAGWDAQQTIAGIAPTLDLAAAAGMDLARASDIVTDVLSMFSMSAEEAGRMADTLAAASSRTNTDVDQLGEALKYVGANANAAGMDIEQTAAFLGLLADNGLKGSMAGTTLNAMLRDLKKNAEDGKLAVGEQTVALYDSEGQMRDMTAVMDDLIKATAQMNDEQRDQAIASIMGQEALKGFNIYAAEGAGAISALEKELRNSKGTAADMSAIMQDNLNGSLTNLKSALEEVAISLGSALIPVVEKTVKFIKNITDGFNALDDSTKTTVAQTAAIAAGFALIAGPALLLVGFIPSIIGGFTALTTVIGAIVSPFGIAIASIVAIGAALVIAYNKVEWFRDLFNNVWEFIRNITIATFNYIKDIIITVISDVIDLANKYLNKFKDIWSMHGDAIMTVVGIYINNVKNTINLVMGVIKGIFEIVWPIISNVVKVAWEFIKLVVSSALDIIVGVIDFAMSIIKGDWSGAWSAIKRIAEDIISNIIKFFKNVNLVQVGKDMIKGLIKGISSMATAVVDSVKGVINGAIDGAKKLLGIASPSRVLAELGRWTGEGFAEGIADMTKEVARASEKLAQAAMPNVSQIDMSYATPGGLYTTLSSAVSGTVDVNSRDDMLAASIASLERKLTNLTIVMDEREVARATSNEMNRELGRKQANSARRVFA